jgi:hypothetical protein
VGLTPSIPASETTATATPKATAAATIAATAATAAGALDALSLEEKEGAKAEAGGGSDHEEEDEEGRLLEGAPDDCVCPVSFVFLTEPVVAADSFTCACLEGQEQRRGVDRSELSVIAMLDFALI